MLMDQKQIMAAQWHARINIFCDVYLLQANEIKLMDRAAVHGGVKAVKSEQQWQREMNFAARRRPEYVGCDEARGLEGEMLAGVWGPVFAGALAAADAAWSPAQLDLPMATLQTAASLAAKYGLHAPLDHLLSQLLTLSHIPATSLHTVAQMLGSSAKAQKALMAMSTVAREHGDAVSF